MPKEITISVDFRSPNGNVVRNMPGWKYAKLKKEVINRLKYTIEVMGIHLRVSGKVKIVYDRQIRSKRYQQDAHDNLPIGSKPWFDALTILGIIPDDSPDDIEVEYKQTVSKEPKTILIFSQMPRFAYTSDGYLKARIWLREIGEWDRVSSSGFSTDGMSIVHTANSVWERLNG